MEQILKDLEAWGHNMANLIQVFNGLVHVWREEMKEAAKKDAAKLLLPVLLLLIAIPAYSQVIPYTIQTTAVALQDINNNGDLVMANAVRYTNGQTRTLDCGGGPTQVGATTINARADAAGLCADSAGNEMGFLFNKIGQYTLLMFPGAQSTLGFGANDYGDVCGQYVNPFTNPNQFGPTRIHGFCWYNNSSQNLYLPFDVPVANSYTTLWAINNHNQILGDFTMYDPNTFNTVAHYWFIYDNGIWDFPFPPSFDFMPGGSSVEIVDLNNLGQSVMLYTNEIGQFGWYLVDDGAFYLISLPPTINGLIAQYDINGLNDNGQLAGQYVASLNCLPPHLPSECKRASGGFIATQSTVSAKDVPTDPKQSLQHIPRSKICLRLQARAAQLAMPISSQASEKLQACNLPLQSQR
jgi:hypothetical protein